MLPFVVLPSISLSFVYIYLHNMVEKMIGPGTKVRTGTSTLERTSPGSVVQLREVLCSAWVALDVELVSIQHPTQQSA